jgi:hypothetical protein
MGEGTSPGFAFARISTRRDTKTYLVRKARLSLTIASTLEKPQTARLHRRHCNRETLSTAACVGALADPPKSRRRAWLPVIDHCGGVLTAQFGDEKLLGSRLRRRSGCSRDRRRIVSESFKEPSVLSRSLPGATNVSENS